MKRMLFLGLLVLLGSVAASAFADGFIVIHEQPGWSPPVLRPPIWPPPRPIPPQPWPPPRVYPFAPLEVTYHKVNVKITDQIATTTVDEEFFNPNSARLEGTYLFPVPKGAQIDKFAMEINGKRTEAELLPADKARGIYEDIVRKLRDPALLEYADRDVFKVRVFPIEPHSPKRITLTYSQLLPADGGLVSYVYPLNTEKFSAKPIKDVSVKVELETKRPLKSIYSPSHPVEIHRDGANHATASFEAHAVRPDTDFALYFAPEKDELGVNLMSFRNPGEDGYFLLLASPGVDVKEKNVVRKDVAFVLDTSGSMAGRKIEQAKKALEFCVENLNDGDRFEVIRFSTEVEPLFNELADATKANRDRAETFIRDLKAIGGTAIDDALRRALALRPAQSDRPFVVIFLTDGLPTVGNTDENQILANVKKEAGPTRVFVFGVGTDVNTHLLDKVADATRAVSQYVLPEEDLEVKLSSFYSKIKEPVLANPTLRFTGDIQATKLYPSPLPDLFRGDQLVLVGRYAGQGAAAAVLEGMVNGEKKRFAFDVKFPAEAKDHEFIPRLWATRRVGWLLDEIRLNGESNELKDEVSDLARKYGIVTPYTAYLIVEDETRRGVAANEQTLPQLREDRAAFDVAGRAFGGLSRDKAGDAAVANSMAGSSLRYAASPEPSSMAPAQSQLFMRRYGLSPTAPGGGRAPAPSAEVSAAERVTQYARQQRFVAGRSFFQNGAQWVDAGVQQQPNAKRVRIQFASPEYFDLLRTQPQIQPWLALGQNLQFLLHGTIYEIYADTKPTE